MEKSILIIIFLLLILIFWVVGSSFLKSHKDHQVCFGDNCFYIELAETPDEWKRGLMFREKLDENRGMLFIFDEEKERSFWMKNTLIPLDIIWINKNKEIIFISKNNQPCKTDKCQLIRSEKKVKYVLEVPAGIADKCGLTVGDKAVFKIN